MMSASVDLFGASHVWPLGLSYIEDFLSIEEERGLLTGISGLPLHEAQYYEYTAKRRVASFGKSYDFAQRALLDAPP